MSRTFSDQLYSPLVPFDLIRSSATLRDRTQWPRGLRHRSAATRLLWLRVRIQPWAWMLVCCECCVFSYRGVCVELITRPEVPYWLWCAWVWSCILDNEEAVAHQGLLHYGEKGRHESRVGEWLHWHTAWLSTASAGKFYDDILLTLWSLGVNICTAMCKEEGKNSPFHPKLCIFCVAQVPKKWLFPSRVVLSKRSTLCSSAGTNFLYSDCILAVCRRFSKSEKSNY
jgi:hypothetical protein